MKKAKQVLVCILLKTIVRACHKLARINEIWMLNLAPQIILFYRPPQREKQNIAYRRV